MQQIPELVKELGLSRLTNAVYVGTIKFTIDQMRQLYVDNQDKFPALLTAQYTDARSAWATLDDAYAQTLRNAISDEISALDKEGDQLLYAVRGTVDAALRMTFNAEKVERAKYFNEFWKKYRIDPTENMIAEWSKVQQAMQEANTNYQLELAAKALGIWDVVARLTTIADTIRKKITERSAQLPELQQMKKARVAMDPEYKRLIQILNAFLIANADFAQLASEMVAALNRNIDYIRIHAVSKAGSGEEENEKADGEAEQLNKDE